MGRVLSYLSVLYSHFSWSGLAVVFSRIGSYVLLLFRKKVFLALAVLTTFQDTLTQAYLLVSKSSTIGSVWNAFTSEAYTKFLGAAPEISQGLTQLIQYLSQPLQLNLLQNSIIHLWTGIASVYMLLFLWTWLIRSKVHQKQVDGWEKALILTIWLLASALVHGPEQVIQLFDQVKTVLDSTANVVGVENIQNETMNKTQ